MEKPLDEDQLAIEKFLPSKFIYQVGAYLQTCAHIELAACSLIVCLEGNDPSDEEWFDSYCLVRKLRTSKLLARLCRSSALAEKFGFSEELETLAERIKRFVDNRHMAAHGAFFGTPAGFLQVDHVQNIGTRNAPQYELNRNAITADSVEEALQDANQTYLNLIDFLESIKPGLFSEITQKVRPIVSHPK